MPVSQVRSYVQIYIYMYALVYMHTYMFTCILGRHLCIYIYIYLSIYMYDYHLLLTRNLNPYLYFSAGVTHAFVQAVTRELDELKPLLLRALHNIASSPQGSEDALASGAVSTYICICIYIYTFVCMY
jgi:hypothetical protein